MQHLFRALLRARIPGRVLCGMVIAWSAGPLAAELQPVSHTLDFSEARNHYVLVESVVPVDATGGTLEIAMAVWTPGSYLIREYAKNIESLRAAADGVALTVRKTAKNRWSIAAGGHERVTVTYRLYCRVLTVQGNWVENDFAMLNGAPTFLTNAADLEASSPSAARTHHVRLRLAEGWNQSVTGLPRRGDRPHDYVARSFDVLVDSPILAGNPSIYEFEVAGKKHYLVNQGEDGIWDGPRSAEDVRKIVEIHHAFWQSVPYEDYHFLNVIEEARGGLEHLDSTLLLTSRWNARVPKKYKEWLGLVSHEFFHTWNVKRLRPAALGPFDYEQEVFTRSLWIAEGITSYYDDLLLARAGLLEEKEYLEALTKQIERLQSTPGRLVHSLEMTSYDAWIKYYRRDENSVNTTISYYTKGAVVAFLLDAQIRLATNGQRSLDHVMRAAYDRFSGERGFLPEDFRALASEIAGTRLARWFRHALESTDELDYAPALAWYGLRFKPVGDDEKGGHNSKEDDAEDSSPTSTEEEKKDEPKKKKPFLGVTTRNESGRLVVTQVRRETPAYRAGLNVDDEILAIDDFRVRATRWSERLAQYAPGDQVELLIARRDALMRIALTFGEPPEKRWKLQIDPDATDEQVARRRAWLGGPDPDASDS